MPTKAPIAKTSESPEAIIEKNSINGNPEPENVIDNSPIGDMIGKDMPSIIKYLLKSSAYKHHDCLKITNLTFHEDPKTGQLDPSRISITIASKLPQFLLDADQETGEVNGYVLGTTSVIYTDIIRLTALLKAADQMALADIAKRNPKLLLSILQGARISLFGRQYADGDIEQNPFSSRINEYECTHDMIRYYPYDITLGEAGIRVGRQLETMMLQRALDL